MSSLASKIKAHSLGGKYIADQFNIKISSNIVTSQCGSYIFVFFA